MIRVLASVAAGALLAGAAFAADPVMIEPVPAMAPVAVGYDWSGFYVGAFAGWGWGEVDTDDLETAGGGGYNGSLPYSFDADGFLGGAQVGGDWQWNWLVFGVGGEFGYLGLDGSDPDPLSPGLDTVASFESDWYGAVTGRLGVAFNRVLIYGRGGAAFLNAEASIVDACIAAPCGGALINATDDDILAGWTAGAGAEIAIGQNWSIGGEYRYYDFGDGLDPAGLLGGVTFSAPADLENVHTGRASINFRW